MVCSEFTDTQFADRQYSIIHLVLFKLQKKYNNLFIHIYYGIINMNIIILYNNMFVKVFINKRRSVRVTMIRKLYYSGNSPGKGPVKTSRHVLYIMRCFERHYRRFLLGFVLYEPLFFGFEKSLEVADKQINIIL